MNTLRDFFVPTGRLRRRYFLISILASHVLYLAAKTLVGRTTQTWPSAISLVAAGIILVALVVHVSAFANRLHDIGVPAWPLVLIPMPVLMAFAMGTGPAGLALSAAAYICVLIQCGLTGGVAGANTYGPNPRG